ncbi:sll7030 (plasmid) [Synechocystis sp. PCC 6803]|jgi:GNAT superfamily N-acetyltransferase|uniref:Sll7030 protein n=1 Tax=Synechocystis sp. (strain ATCC 27184 / PCC 6803 / Kazusa) TaxID=1111708 RepID=Q6ZEG8_SYNY3|nr:MULTISPECIES: GNAT family N-acetyltransferase [unclassified Synechocystis]AGF53584.1 hypothetical protein MYO_4280 [Synechocystis sp. PCC 6803]AVP91436.1 N-acetyltransferase [Synechocystis sp. IPPAS B-1465]MBD2618936.1 GNAT family N-acetyltransferase [Synechocystis sp. FACHB-898]MBD2637427.1 GNAT family N-acetyltransferase [Synechocystis sp. FACHB-908]MBD2661554.1 GNAT family N-acetyltransferase [Synechocystis sp. FACHB-929]
MVLKIELLDSRIHQRSDFYCGEASLDTYIQKQASQDLKRKIATIFVLVDNLDKKVLGYYTLSAYTVNIAYLETDFAKGLPRYPMLPATLLGRLAVDQNYKGQGLGELLLIDALKRAWETSQLIASLAVIVEALNDQASNFYIKYGFVPFNQQPSKLYLAMKSVERLF